MAQVNSKPGGSQKKSKLAAWIILGVVSLTVLQYLIITVIVPLAQDNGVNRFSGAKRVAAEQVADLVLTNEIDNKSRWGYKVFVEDVYPTPEGTCSSENAISNNGPDDPRYYTVITTTKPLLSYGSGDKKAHPGCNKYWLPELRGGDATTITPMQ